MVSRAGEKLRPAGLQLEYGCLANRVRCVLMRWFNLGLDEFELEERFRAATSPLNLHSHATKLRIMQERLGVTGSVRLGGVAKEFHHPLIAASA